VRSIENKSIEDIPLIRGLAMQVWPQTYRSIIPDDQIAYMLNMMYSAGSLQRQMEDGAQFIVVYDDKEPVGFASYQEIRPSIYKLHKIYVLISQQGKGTGRFLIDHIIDVIKKKGATALQLQVNRGNKARYFYEKLGFAIIEEIDLDIGGGYVMDDYIMEKQFS
jgi:GNAT superfamily N-acetyltransferase